MSELLIKDSSHTVCANAPRMGWGSILERFQIICSRTIHVTRRAGLRGIASEISHAKSAKFAKFGRASGISLAENAEFTFGERHKSRLRRKTVFDGSRHGHAGS